MKARTEREVSEEAPQDPLHGHATDSLNLRFAGFEELAGSSNSFSRDDSFIGSAAAPGAYRLFETPPEFGMSTITSGILHKLLRFAHFLFCAMFGPVP